MQGVRNKPHEVGSSVSRHTLRAHPRLEADTIPGPENGIRNGNGYSPGPQSAPLKNIPAIPLIIKEDDGID